MKSFFTTLKIPLFLLLLVAGILSHAQVVYVDQDATGTRDGASWANAMTNLQSAIDAAATVATSSNPIQVWVKADTYLPTTTTTQTISFEIKNNVEMYGGFEGTESLLGQRDIARFPTILSGNIGSKSDSTDNSDRILLASSNITNSALVDGFTFTGAHINNTGGAIVMNGTAAELTINNCTFNGNYASFGSAINAYFASNANSKLNVYNSIFYHNGALGSQSGAIGSKNAVTIANCLFYGNKSYIGGAVAVQDGSLTLTNSTFAGNAVGLGGGSALVTQNVSLLSMRNSIFWNNSGGSYYTTYGSTGSFVLSNNLVNVDPLFVDYPNKDFSIGECSPAVNIGNNSAAAFSEDLAGNPRIYGANVDAGAYENQFEPLSFSAVEKFDVTCFGNADGQIAVNGAGGSGTVEYSIDGTNFSSIAIFTGLVADTYSITVRDVGNGCIYSEQHTLTQPSELGLTLSSTNITCNGDDDGTISGTASGGTAPYQISFDGGTSFVGSQFTTNFSITDMSGGSYQVSVVDLNGCVFTSQANIQIVEPSAISASPVVANVLCNGESTGGINANASGGTAPLFYTLEGINGTHLTSPIFSDLAAGSYTLTVIDARECYEEYQIEIQEPSELVINYSTTDALCDGGQDGTFTISISGGTGPYSFTYGDSNPITTGSASGNLAAGTYAINATDANGCITSETMVIDNQVTVGGSIINETNPSCHDTNDGSVEVAGSGGSSPYTYSMDGSSYQSSGTFTGLTGSYVIQVRDDNGCETTVQGQLTSPTALGINLSQQGSMVTVAATGGTAPYEYSADGSTFQSSAQFTNLAPDNYTFRVRDANGCEITGSFDVVLGITNSEVSVFPNPVNDVLTIQGLAYARLTIHDITGRRVLIAGGEQQIDMTGLERGMHFLNLFDAKGAIIHQQKLMIN